MQPTIRSGRLAGQRELQQRLLADDRLVQQHVVEHAAQRVPGVGSACAATSTASLIAMPSEPGWSGSSARIAAPGLGELATGERCTVRAEGLHHRCAGTASGRRRRRPATPRTRGRTARRRRPARVPHWPAPVSVVSFVTPASARCSTPAARRCSACASRPARRPRTCSRSAPACRAPSPAGAPGTAATAATAGRRRAPRPGMSTYRSVGHLLQDQVHREQRREVVRADRLQRARVQRRRRRRGQVGDDVVPLRRHLRLVEQDLVLELGHGILLPRSAATITTASPTLAARAGPGKCEPGNGRRHAHHAGPRGQPQRYSGFSKSKRQPASHSERWLP